MTINHLSPSSLSLFRSQPALWVLKYLMGARDEAGPAAWRGSAVEAGLDVILYKVPGDPWVKANERFELDAQGEARDDMDKQRGLLAPLLQQATEAVKELGLPNARQFKIEHWLDGIEWPILGYVDYLYPEFGFDLKTTERMPSEPRADHVMQVSLYAAATKRPFRLLYVTPKKFQWFSITPEHQAIALSEARAIARNIQALLGLSADPARLLAALPADFENFRWSSNLKQLHMQAIGENNAPRS